MSCIVLYMSGRGLGPVFGAGRSCSLALWQTGGGPDGCLASEQPVDNTGADKHMLSDMYVGFLLIVGSLSVYLASG